MEIRIDHYFHGDPRLDDILHQLSALAAQVGTMNAALQAKFDELTAKVTAETSVVQSAVTLLQGLSAIIADLRASVNDNPEALAKISEIEALVDGGRQQLADAVVANTPAE